MCRHAATVHAQQHNSQLYALPQHLAKVLRWVRQQQPFLKPLCFMSAVCGVTDRLTEDHLLTASGPALLEAILARLKGAEDRMAGAR